MANAPASRSDHRLYAPCRAAPFACAETAWFWTASCLRARQESCLRARQEAIPAPGPGPCRPEDVVKCLDGLYRQRRVELLHVRILRIWGWRGTAPNPARVRERCDWRLWHEAMGRLEWPLRVRGIVVAGLP